MANLKIPKHIAFIMDGNGRWANKRLLPRKLGHREGVIAMEKVIKACNEYGIEAVTFYAFSTENWSRPKDEIAALFELVEIFVQKHLPKYVAENYRVRFMGDLAKLPQNVQDAIFQVLESVKNNDGMLINIALNYGGRDEIIYAVKNLVINNLDITQENLESNLYTNGIPAPDIIVRSSGEKRLSNFMLWQCAYSEFIFCDELWPDFDKKQITSIIEEYSKRDRRFGRIK